MTYLDYFQELTAGQAIAFGWAISMILTAIYGAVEYVREEGKLLADLAGQRAKERE